MTTHNLTMAPRLSQYRNIFFQPNLTHYDGSKGPQEKIR